MNGLWYILSGLAAGVLAGMGMGGGTLLIPLLTLALGVGQQDAQGINMLAFLPGAVLALWIHKKAGRVTLKGCWPMLLFGLLGSALGALAAGWIQTECLKKLFGIFLIILGLLQWKRGNAAPERKK